jgi:Protein of unknown function (DUF1588)/Protein of unknown function (DUF1592)
MFYRHAPPLLGLLFAACSERGVPLSKMDGQPDAATAQQDAAQQDAAIDAVRTPDAQAPGPTSDAAVRRHLPDELPPITAPLVVPDPSDDLTSAAGAPQASALAYDLARFIWRALPDEQTLALAREGALNGAEGMHAEAQRLLMDPRADRGFLSFFGAWAEYERAETLIGHLARADAGAGVTQLDAAAPLVDYESFSQAARAEFEAYVTELVRSEGKLSDLFLAPVEIREATLKELYLDEPATSRTGILSQPFLLFAGSYPDRPSPSRRGAFISRRVLCRELTVTEESRRGQVPSELSTRAWITEATHAADCAECHRRFDPLGFAFENFDQWGKGRSRVNGEPVDTHVALAVLGLPEAQDSNDLGLALLHDRNTLPCLLSQWFSYALQRSLNDADTAAWVELARGAEFYTLLEIPALIAASSSFRERAAR